MTRWSAVFLAGVPVLLAQAPVNPRPFRLQELKTPAGFEVSVYAHLDGEPRLMAIGPNGVLYVAARAGSIYAIPVANQAVRVLSGLRGPQAVAFRGDTLYVATDDALLRFTNATPPDLVIRGSAEKLAALPSGGQHNTRTVGLDADGRLYVTAGSTCNFCIEADSRRAAMLRFDPDGSNQSIYATGLRNSVGFAWHPVTGELWATDNGGDGLGDDIPPEEINILREGGDYGWPDCMGQQLPVDWGPSARPGRCPATLAPEWEMQAHSAPLGISFYTGAQFPASYTNDALVAFHGSWNRNTPTGYKLVRVRASSGHAAGIEDFLWGFLDVSTRTRSGRPVHALTGPDGSVYVSDDAAGNIYRVAYTGPRLNPGGIVQRAPGVFEIYGANLVNDPARLSVSVNNSPAAILYAAANQINIRIGPEITGDLTFQVTNEKASDQVFVPAPSAQ